VRFERRNSIVPWGVALVVDSTPGLAMSPPQLDSPLARVPVPERSAGVERYDGTLLTSRAFVRDMAIFAEHIVMNDVHAGFFDFHSGAARGKHTAPAVARALAPMLRCREKAPWWAMDKVGELSERPPSEASRCNVRLRRAAWAVSFARRWSPEVLEWVDTGVEMEKAVSVLRLWGAGDAEPTIAIAFRGSKAAADYYKTDASPYLVPLPGNSFSGEPARLSNVDSGQMDRYL